MSEQKEHELSIVDALKGATLSYISKRLEEAEKRGVEEEDFGKIKGYIDIISNVCRDMETAKNSNNGMVDAQTIDGWFVQVRDARQAIILHSGKMSSVYLSVINICVEAIEERLDKYKAITNANTGALFAFALREKELEQNNELLNKIQKAVVMPSEKSVKSAEHEQEIVEVFGKIEDFKDKLAKTNEGITATQSKQFKKFLKCLDKLEIEYKGQGVTHQNSKALGKLVLDIERAKAEYYAHCMRHPRPGNKLRDQRIKLVADTMEIIKKIKVFPEVKASYDKAMQEFFNSAKVKNNTAPKNVSGPAPRG